MANPLRSALSQALRYGETILSTASTSSHPSYWLLTGKAGYAIVCSKEELDAGVAKVLAKELGPVPYIFVASSAAPELAGKGGSGGGFGSFTAKTGGGFGSFTSKAGGDFGSFTSKAGSDFGSFTSKTGGAFGSFTSKTGGAFGSTTKTGAVRLSVGDFTGSFPDRCLQSTTGAIGPSRSLGSDGSGAVRRSLESTTGLPRSIGQLAKRGYCTGNGNSTPSGFPEKPTEAELAMAQYIAKVRRETFHWYLEAKARNLKMLTDLNEVKANKRLSISASRQTVANTAYKLIVLLAVVTAVVEVSRHAPDGIFDWACSIFDPAASSEVPAPPPAGAPPAPPAGAPPAPPAGAPPAPPAAASVKA